MYEYRGTILRAGRSWKDENGVKHPHNWATAWSEEYKTQMGLIKIPVKPPYDNRFYWGWAEDGSGLIERDLTSLQATFIDQVKSQAQGKLKSTDWLVLRGYEDPGKPMSQDIKSYRSSVRAASNDIEAKILACTTIDELRAMFDAPLDENGVPTGNAPMYDWPIDPDAQESI